MNLISFRIKGFKSIIDTGECKLSEIDNITVLAGQNEAGKSAVLEALEFFGNGPGKDYMKLQKRQDSETTEVLCKFKLLDSDIENVIESINEEPITKHLKANRIITVKRISNAGDSQELSINTDYFASLEEKLLKRQDSELPDDQKQAQVTKIITDLSTSLLKNIPKITLYSNFKDFLPSEIPIAEIPNNQAVRDFEKVFNTDFTRVSSITDERQLEATTQTLTRKATDDFNMSWSQRISISEETKYQYIIKVYNHEPKRVVFMIQGADDNPLYLEQKSMGFRWFSAFHLRLRAMGAEPKSLNNLLLLVDEPGQNLHESAQLDAKKVLEELADKGVQILYSTHNARLIGVEGSEFARIRLVSNTKQEGTKIHTVSQFVAKPEFSSTDALSPIVTAMGLKGISSIVEGAGRYNVVVEGITDHYYLNAFKKLLNKNKDLFFVPSCGVNNVPSIVSLLLGWRLKYKAVFDDDPGAGRKAYNLLKKYFYSNEDSLTQMHVHKLKGCNGIEDLFSCDDFDKYITGTARENKGVRNSELAKGKKEILAKQFLEKAENEGTIQLDKTTLEGINAVFDWLYSAFNIKEE